MPTIRSCVPFVCSLLCVLSLTAPSIAQPANDSCIDPTVVPSLPFADGAVGTGSTVTAIPGCVAGPDQWYAYTAPALTDVTITSGPGSVTVYLVPGGVVGVCPSESDRVVCDVPAVLITMQPGDLVLVQHHVTMVGTNFLAIDAVPDRCITAREVDAFPFVDSVDLGLFTEEPGFPSCPTAHDAWLVHHATEGGTLAFGVGVGGVFIETSVAVFESDSFTPGVCPSDSDLVACDVEVGTVTLVAGLHYWFRISSPLGDFDTVQLDWLDPLPNDDCSTALPIQIGVPESPELLVATATPVPAGCGTGVDAWYTLTPTTSNPLRVVFPGGIDSTVAIFEAAPPGTTCPGALVTCSPSGLQFTPVAGQEYLVQMVSDAPRVVNTIVVNLVDGTAADDRYRFEIVDGVAVAGSSFRTPFRLTSSAGLFGAAQPLAGLSFGVCVDPAAVDLISVELGATLQTINVGSPPDYWDVDLSASGFTGGFVVNFLGLAAIPPESVSELFVIHAFPLAAAGSTITLEFCPWVPHLLPTDQVVVPPGGFSVTPVLDGGAIAVIAAADFRRGDANLDATVDIADVMTILDVLFDPAPSAFSCALSADVNDDELVDIGDAIALIDHLFGPVSVPIPPPVCGQDPTPGTLDCTVPAICP